MRSGRCAPLLLLLLLLAPFSLPAQEKTLEIIPLHHRTAEQLIGALRPFVDPNGIIKAHGDRLIIKTSAKNLAELKRLVATLDQPLRQLIITVRQARLGEYDSQQLGASGELSSEGETVTIEAHRTAARDQAVAEQQIRTLEGHPATIRIGRAIPVGEQSTQQTPWGPQSQSSIKYKSLTRGFTVIPRLQGDDEVILEIVTQAREPATSGGGVINVQGAKTTLRARLGQWIELGGAAEGERSTSQKIIHRTASRDETQRQILIRVTEVHSPPATDRAVRRGSSDAPR